MPDPSNLEPDYAPAFHAWKAAPGPETGAAVLNAVRPVMDAAVTTYGGPAAGPAVRAKAKAIVLDSLPRYDPASAPLRPYLTQQLKGLYRYAGREAATVRVPERIRLHHRLLTDATRELDDRLGRPPSDAELADHTGVPIARIAKVRRASFAPASGSRYAEEEEAGGRAVAGDTQGWEKFVYHTLHPVDQLVMEWTLGLRGRPVLSNQEIAKQLNVTPGAVSQRKARIQGYLDNPSAGLGGM